MPFFVLGQILNMGGPCSVDLDRDDSGCRLGRVLEVTLVFTHVCYGNIQEHIPSLVMDCSCGGMLYP